eukprot:TRINITY_DN9954_c0_g1_i1.p1 TRINITY_DN9954_c0_g1~~TRINITY_DN9954_c0_g1_i1.p1  ORF type:complete len:1193 (-),score=160.03 TRINITY_DN9954_c0_g1_i1:92-3670(-)
MTASKPRLSQAQLTLSTTSFATNIALSARGPSGLLQHSSLLRQRELKPVLKSNVLPSSVFSPRTSDVGIGIDGCNSPSGHGRPPRMTYGKHRRSGAAASRDGPMPRQPRPCPSTSPPRISARATPASNRLSGRRCPDTEHRAKAGLQRNRSHTDVGSNSNRKSSASTPTRPSITASATCEMSRDADTGENSAPQRQQRDPIQEDLQHEHRQPKVTQPQLQDDGPAQRLQRDLSFEAIALFLSENGFSAIGDELRARVREAADQTVDGDAFARGVRQLGVVLCQVSDRQWDAKATAAALASAAQSEQFGLVETPFASTTWASDVCQRITTSPETYESVPHPPWKRRFDAELEERLNNEPVVPTNAVNIEGNSELYAAGVLPISLHTPAECMSGTNPSLECTSTATKELDGGQAGDELKGEAEVAEAPEEERPMPQMHPRVASSMHYMPMSMGTPEGFIDDMPDEYRNDHDPGYRIREISEEEFLAELQYSAIVARQEAATPTSTSIPIAKVHEDLSICKTLFAGFVHGPLESNESGDCVPSVQRESSEKMLDPATAEEGSCEVVGDFGCTNDERTHAQDVAASTVAMGYSTLVYTPSSANAVGNNIVAADGTASANGENDEPSAADQSLEAFTSGAPELTGREPLPHFGRAGSSASGTIQAEAQPKEGSLVEAYAAARVDPLETQALSTPGFAYLPENTGSTGIGSLGATPQLSQPSNHSYPVELQDPHDSISGHQNSVQQGSAVEAAAVVVPAVAAVAAVGSANTAVASATNGPCEEPNVDGKTASCTQMEQVILPYALPPKRKERSEGSRPPCRHAPSGDPFYPVQLDGIVYDSFPLRIVYERDCTGFEESKEFPIQINSIVAARYQVLAYLGSAAFSQAVQCLDLETNMMVCMKIIKNDKDFVDQSLDEIKLLKIIAANTENVDDKHCLQLFDCFYHKEHLIIVTELLRDNLYEFSKFNRECGAEAYFTLGRLQKITKQVLVALEYIHSMWLIHADLKPENILVKSYSRCEVKVIDFGSSCFMHDRLSSYVQSRSYRSPEVMLGLPYSQKIDVWSLGCIVAELWTGYVLFQNDCVQSLLARICGIVGDFPRHMLATGKLAAKYFTQDGQLFRELDVPTNLTCSQRVGSSGRRIHTYLPKKSSLRQRMRCTDELFVNFLETVLQIDPAKRPGSAEALRHPWLTPGRYLDGL